jgi:GntR family transcriptional regulator of abcA and norABC
MIYATLLKRNEMIRGLQQIMSDSVTFTTPQGGLNIWCTITRQVDDFKLLDEAIKRGVLFVPGSVYGSDHGCIRLSFARPKLEEIIPGITQLNEVIQMVCK